MPRVGIALGSNLGDRQAHLAAARVRLREIATAGEPILEAADFKTEPLDCPLGSPEFLNSVVEIDFAGEPLELLALTQEIEKALGRAANPQRNAPRVIDVDLLYFGGEIVVTPQLILPHPRIGERLFVLEPLASIRPDLILPGQRASVVELLARLAAAVPA